MHKFSSMSTGETNWSSTVYVCDCYDKNLKLSFCCATLYIIRHRYCLFVLIMQHVVAAIRATLPTVVEMAACSFIRIEFDTRVSKATNCSVGRIVSARLTASGLARSPSAGVRLFYHYLRGIQNDPALRVAVWRKNMFSYFYFTTIH